MQVDIRLKDYGASLIEVSDNGSGKISKTILLEERPISEQGKGCKFFGPLCAIVEFGLQ